ncbi:entericidin A/B family lipoprotein [Chitinolyticbacter meiyuanensis]|nr:entericidin A/B family lipoprotein [Chitinolyticbacter meiyuanensis]
MRRFALILAACAALAALPGCNTVNGFGKDLKKLGDQIEEKSAK